MNHIISMTLEKLELYNGVQSSSLGYLKTRAHVPGRRLLRKKTSGYFTKQIFAIKDSGKRPRHVAHRFGAPDNCIDEEGRWWRCEFAVRDDPIIFVLHTLLLGGYMNILSKVPKPRYFFFSKIARPSFYLRNKNTTCVKGNLEVYNVVKFFRSSYHLSKTTTAPLRRHT
jgi:hypothetical protein